ncbi:hypothetical protein F2Q68_00019278 [Brassica cretica]|uniref:Uncharacterized protein n=1 Tax=Brassica cretica TaxID=69181 RepID=A0A8S9FZQ0_BRACR|nr:hypothetical protein F2Q68_00019278 [Brassica cretica]
MQNRWVLPGRASTVQPSSSTSGDALLPPPFPPDPPDPSSPLSPHLFPPLASTPPPSRSEIRRSSLSNSPLDIVMAQALDSSPALAISETTTQFGSLAEIASTLTIPATGNPSSNSHSPTTSSSPHQEQLSPSLVEPTSTILKILPPKHLRLNPSPSNTSTNRVVKLLRFKVDYPWLPPKCSHCSELGHVVRNCLLFTPPKEPAARAPGEKAKQKTSDSSKKTTVPSAKTKQYVVKKTIPPIITDPLLFLNPSLSLLAPQPSKLPLLPFPLPLISLYPPLKVLLTNLVNPHLKEPVLHPPFHPCASKNILSIIKTCLFPSFLRCWYLALPPKLSFH